MILIWCADGNTKHSQLAIDAGWEYGLRLPARGFLPDHKLYFADQHYRQPNRRDYMTRLAIYRPKIATVLDWEQPEQLTEVLSWAEEAAQHVTDGVVIIPKVSGSVGALPARTGGKEVILGYSVPTSYGGSPVFLSELKGWPVHLLGGSPQRQYEVWTYLRHICDVRSLDGNMAKKQATGRCLYWTREVTSCGHWQPLSAIQSEDRFCDRPHEECVRRTTVAVKEAWDFWTR
jgi:hypothetical protein